MPALFEKNHQFPDLPAVSPVAGFCNPYQFEQFHSYLQRANFPSPIAQELRMFHAPSHVANSHVYDSLKITHQEPSGACTKSACPNP